jgi:hypothetical protein
LGGTFIWSEIEPRLAGPGFSLKRRSKDGVAPDDYLLVAMKKWLSGAVVVLILIDAAVFALWMMDNPLFTSLQNIVNAMPIKTITWWNLHQLWNTHH